MAYTFRGNSAVAQWNTEHAETANQRTNFSDHFQCTALTDYWINHFFKCLISCVLARTAKGARPAAVMERKSVCGDFWKARVGGFGAYFVRRVPLHTDCV